MNLAAFLDTYRDALAQAVVRAYPPLYDAETRQACGFDLRRLLRRPLGAQADAIRATALALQKYSSASIVGEMGTGKSYVGVAAAYLAGCRRVLVLCPPHLVKKWRREILQTVPGARVAIVRTIRDLERVREQGGGLQFVVCSREQAKLGYRWTPAALARALARRPVILLLDEATSHLDMATEALVDHNLSRLACTRIVVAHRLSTIRNADLILVLDEGRIVERGCHEGLLARNGHYAALIHSQMKRVEDDHTDQRGMRGQSEPADR